MYCPHSSENNWMTNLRCTSIWLPYIDRNFWISSSCPEPTGTEEGREKAENENKTGTWLLLQCASAMMQKWLVGECGRVISVTSAYHAYELTWRWISTDVYKRGVLSDWKSNKINIFIFFWRTSSRTSVLTHSKYAHLTVVLVALKKVSQHCWHCRIESQCSLQYIVTMQHCNKLSARCYYVIGFHSWAEKEWQTNWPNPFLMCWFMAYQPNQKNPTRIIPVM